MSLKSSVTTIVRRTVPKFRIAVRLLRDPRGATAIEYGLILAFVVLAMIVGLTALADGTVGMWNKVSTKVSTAR